MNFIMESIIYFKWFLFIWEWWAGRSNRLCYCPMEILAASSTGSSNLKIYACLYVYIICFLKKYQFYSTMELILYSMQAIIFMTSKIYFDELISSNWRVCLKAKFSWTLR